MQQNQLVQTEQNILQQTQSEYEHLTPKYTQLNQQITSVKKQTQQLVKKLQQVHRHQKIFTEFNVMYHQPTQKLISSPIEGRALLNNLIFPSHSKMLLNLIDLRQDQTIQKENQLTNRKRFYVQSYKELKVQKNEQNSQIQNVKFPLNKQNKFIQQDQNITKQFKRSRYISLQMSRTQCQLSINGTQSIVTSRDITPKKK
ncbi:unnamed protein product (macronuclear) [Paramecium tetraurelia]|uniref:Uncharacterized protein n=1 Tax=Paramecium tetraurelia TaxID=5888 RepID=A0CL03_PARTE|nr:uncharacterized protein GSPATT00008017001 [Paramecium tetraurelia]CAK71470.1 unnamed protein product [Paramecium tetraurelia]|eukprot:XP_001438867.1 hypothetical protein (macronuclear) [Paramecium tetraurelia strain d4-2]